MEQHRLHMPTISRVLFCFFVSYFVCIVVVVVTKTSARYSQISWQWYAVFVL
jgi:hypothetical protein